jgi:hypothetical protein
MQQEVLSKAVSALLRLPPGQPSPRIEPLAAGGNNRVFVADAAGRRHAVKVYFRHPSDRRDRLHAEYAFLECAAAAGLRCVPAPLARDDAHGIGLYEFLPGRKLAAGDIRIGHVDRAARFFCALNAPVVRARAKHLPSASEACFSIDAHFAMVDGRIARLGRIVAEVAVDAEARAFAATLARRWAKVRDQIRAAATAMGLSTGAEISDRCISPSDFGFHNAIETDDRGLCFIDFEYAGWDDPAKLVGDFFSHPAIPVSHDHLERFMDLALAYGADPEALKRRARLLFPLFQIKWCCIMLNEFLPEAAERRRFADPRGDFTARKRTQLEKAGRLFAQIRA